MESGAGIEGEEEGMLDVDRCDDAGDGFLGEVVMFLLVGGAAREER